MPPVAPVTRTVRELLSQLGLLAGASCRSALIDCGGAGVSSMAGAGQGFRAALTAAMIRAATVCTGSLQISAAEGSLCRARVCSAVRSGQLTVSLTVSYVIFTGSHTSFLSGLTMSCNYPICLGPNPAAICVV